MVSTKASLQQPTLKNGVIVNFKNASIEIRDRHNGFSLTVEEEIGQSVAQLLRLLQFGNLSIEQLTTACPKIAEEIPE